MATTNKTQLFDYLVIGLKEFLSQDQKYPYPDLLRHAMNALSLEIKKSIPRLTRCSEEVSSSEASVLKRLLNGGDLRTQLSVTSFPKTVNGFLRLLEKPVKDWCPSYFIPQEFDHDFGLMDEGSLSEEANEYLQEELITKGKIPENANLCTQQLALDNKKFINVLDKLRDVYNDIDPEQAQQEYLLFRPFLIQNQYTTPSQIRQKFLRAKHISLEDIGELYEECQENQIYWYCDRCGILTEKYGRLKGIKPSLCGNHHKNQSYVHKVRRETGLLWIKEGIHQRVCFPGIPEVNLYSALEELKEKYPNYLYQVKLYPGLDRYDLQLRFSDDTVWAIDLKDVRDPYKLAKNLKPLYSEGSLRYDESFYVISDRCIQNYLDYLEIARKAAKNLPKETHLVSEKDFITKVNNKITKLQKGGET